MEQLPKEVIENVLRRLSVFDIVRAGCASKALRSLVHSRRPTSSQPCVTLLLLHPYPNVVDAALLDRCWAYDPARASWLTLSLAFLQPHLPEHAGPVASDGGLLAFGYGHSFVVCNPLTKSWQKLPSLPQMGQDVVEDNPQAFGLKCDAVSGAYDFFTLNSCYLESHWVSVLMKYSSSSLQWNRMHQMVMPAAPCELHTDTIVCCNSRLYTLWQRGSYLTVNTFGNGSWSEIDMPECKAKVLKAFLMNVSDSLYMVGAVGTIWLREDTWTQPNSVRLWKLHAQSDTWVDVTRMPEPTLHEFQERIDLRELQCKGKNGILHMKSLTSEVLVLNLTTNEWKWLKDLELKLETLPLIFEPSLAAIP